MVPTAPPVAVSCQSSGEVVEHVTGGEGPEATLESLAPNFAERRRFTEVAWDRLLTAVESFQAELEEEFKHVFTIGCSYATGSMARDEANKHSDLDLFIMDCVPALSAISGSRRLDSVEQAHLLSTIDRARQQVGFRRFSQGGRFLTCHAFDKMVDAIGNAEDDASNRFTARMLLMLNSRPIVNAPAYHTAREEVLARYWRQEPDPETPFYPVFLLNDIRRWWGVVLLNFEYNNPPAVRDDESDGARTRRAKRRINNLKLRYARLLASYTPILGILAFAEEGGVRRSRIGPILEATPLERLDQIRQTTSGEEQQLATEMIKMYDDYLSYMSGSEEELQEKVLAADWSRETKQLAYAFGDKVARLMHLLGEGGALYRYVRV